MAKAGRPRAGITEVIDAAPSGPQVLAQQAATAMQVIGYELAYDRERVVTEARFFMSASAEAMLEAGKRLLVIKEHEPHGEFMEIVQDRLGLGVRAAQAMMQAAVKYLDPKLASNAQAPAHLLALGKTKLIELLTEDTDELAVLAEGGTLAGLDLDDISKMTSRELRTALREARADAEADKQLLAKKAAKIDEQQRQLRRIKVEPPDAVLAGLQKATTTLMHEARAAVIGGLRQGFVALAQHHETQMDGTDSRVFMAGVMGQLGADLRALCDEFGIDPLQAEAQPEWLAQHKG